jgi:hypothetical protein
MENPTFLNTVRGIQVAPGEDDWVENSLGPNLLEMNAYNEVETSMASLKQDC